MIKIKEAIVVEGRYDKNTLSQIVDAPIFETAGFGIFKNKEQMALLRRVAEVRGLIVFTDADGAGFVIRNHIKSAIPGQFLKHAYTPDVFGKERRKIHGGKEGKLGVEGMERELLYKLFLPYTDENAGARGLENPLSKTDFYEDGLSGGKDSAARRDELAVKLGLPRGMTANALLAAVRMICTYDEYLAAVGRDKK